MPASRPVAASLKNDERKIRGRYRRGERCPHCDATKKRITDNGPLTRPSERTFACEACGFNWEASDYASERTWR